MKEQVAVFGRRIWKDFLAFSPGQKAVTIVAGLALIIGGYVFATWKSAPTYGPLYTNLAPSDASAIVDKLNTAGTPYKLADAGTEILVPASKVYSTRLTMSAAGLPDSSQSGFSLLDKEGVTTSQFQQQVDYQSALQNELAKTIDSMNGVQNAAVTLAIPQQDVFNDGSQKPTAAVLLTTSPGFSPTSSQVQSITYLVSSSVPQMSADGVTVTDSNGDVLAAPGSGITSAANTSAQSQATQAYDSQVKASLENMLATALGPNNAEVSVNAALDFNQTNITSKNYTYNKNMPPVSTSGSSETYTGTGTVPNGTLGSTDTTATGSGNGTGKYKQTSSTVDNALGTLTQTTQNAPGQVQRLAIAVLVNKSAKNVNLAAIQSLVQSGVGYNAARGDTISVQALPFNTTQQTAAAAAAKAAAKAAAAKASSAHLMSLVKQGLLGLLVLGLVLGSWLTGRRRRKNQGSAAGENSYGLDSELLAFGGDATGDRASGQAAAESVEQGASVSDLQEVTARRRALASTADSRPEDVARVLSGWLSPSES